MNGSDSENQAVSPIVKGTCRFEELKLSSMNEDESKKLVIVQAMFSLLENMNETEADETPIIQEENSISQGIVKICKESKGRGWYC